MKKRVAFIADSLDNAYKFQQIFSKLDLEVSAGSTMQIKKLLTPGLSYDLIVFEARGMALAELTEIQSLVSELGCPLLVIIDASQLDQLHFNGGLRADFVVHGATTEECFIRICMLMSDAVEGQTSEILIVDNMTINLATYQVTVADKPVDLTYLEYALLSFLVRHPGHTFSRDALLQHVWGFDYYGGSRTVDVHVRRIRAKLGPELAQRLETVRGVGYLWSV